MSFVWVKTGIFQVRIPGLYFILLFLDRIFAPIKNDEDDDLKSRILLVF